MQNQEDKILQDEYTRAIKNQQTHVYYDNNYISIKLAQHMLDFIKVERAKQKKQNDEESAKL